MWYPTLTPSNPPQISLAVPAGVELKVMLSPEARNSAWVSFDGRNRQELTHGEVLRITTSVHPVPSISKTGTFAASVWCISAFNDTFSVCYVILATRSILPSADQLHDWFESLADCLHWNVRQTQKSIGSRPADLPKSTRF